MKKKRIIFILKFCIHLNFQNENRRLPFPMDHIKRIGRQVCKKAYDFNYVGKVPTDIKPENVLLVDSSYETTITSKYGRFLNMLPSIVLSENTIEKRITVRSNRLVYN